MKQNPERLAWIVLLSSFAVCVVLTISVPLTIRWWIDSAYVGLGVTSIVQQGTLQLTCGSDSVPIAITERMDDVCQGVETMTILTLSADQGKFTVSTPDVSALPIVQIQVDNNTQLSISHARAPRFSISTQPYRLVIQVHNGRARISTASHLAHPLLIQVNTMETLVQIGQGSVSVQAGLGETYVEVYDGTALVVWNGKGEGITLTRLESVVVPPPGGALQALLPPQDLVVHGDFLALEPNWQVYSKDVELEGEPGGEVALATGDTPVVGFTRIGRGHAETGITQTLDRDVQGVQSLQLRLALRVIEQDVPVCGTRGTECPIMVEIKYEDVQGDSRSWLQGFYVSLDPNRANPPFCTVCSPRADHLRVEQGDWYEYDSPNLIPLLNQAGPPPARLVSIVLYASGHTYRSEVSRVELLARE